MRTVNAVAEVNLPDGAKSVEQDFQLDPGQTLTGTVLDPAGKPLAGAQFRGATERGSWNPLSSSTFTIEGYRPDHPRTLVFIDLERKLAGSHVVEGPQKSPITVQLQPWGAVTGRIIDAKGKPMGDTRIDGNDLPTYLWQKEPGGRLRNLERQYLTDQDGRFRIEGLAPEITYNLWATSRTTGKYIGTVASKMAIEAGQTQDLGDVKIKEPYTQNRSTWRLSIALDAPDLEPPVVQYALFDKDPVAGYIARLKDVRANYQSRLERAASKADKDMIQTSQMTVLWDLGFRDVSGADVHLLKSSSLDAPGTMIGSNGPDGKKWIVSKTVQSDGKPTCWCVPVYVKKGRQTEAALTEANAFDLQSTFDKALQDPDQGE